MKKVIVIGSGIAGLSASASLAAEGYDVTVIEKNNKPGGRINLFKDEGFVFDMGPSWYWMPEVFEDFYQRFGHTASDFYDLKRLDPSYRVIFKDDSILDVPADFNALKDVFESYEKGSGAKLQKFIDQAAYKYEVGMNEFVWKPGKSIFEFAKLKVLKSFFKLQLFQSISKEINSVVKNKNLRQLLEFPVLFLGAAPQDTPALYSLMNYADLKLGTWYPEGGMYKIAEAFYKIAIEQGVKFQFDEEVTSFSYFTNGIKEVHTNKSSYTTDLVVANADYHHIDQNVLDKSHAQYDAAYWDSRKMAPSSLLFYLGIDKKLPGLLHHNLFFDADFDRHAHEIYKDPKWPDDPLFYICAPSVTDSSVAPEGKENLFLLMPLAPDLEGESEEKKEAYLKLIIERVEKQIGVSFYNDIIYKRAFGIKDFKSTYNSFKGNAYGLANTLMQTAVLKPSLKSKKMSNLYFAGQLTTPGPGLPPSIISGQVVASEIIKDFEN